MRRWVLRLFWGAVGLGHPRPGAVHRGLPLFIRVRRVRQTMRRVPANWLRRWRRPVASKLAAQTRTLVEPAHLFRRPDQLGRESFARKLAVSTRPSGAHSAADRHARFQAFLPTRGA